MICHNCHLPLVLILLDRLYLTSSTAPFYKAFAGICPSKPRLFPYFAECSQRYVLLAMYCNGYLSGFCGMFKLHVRAFLVYFIPSIFTKYFFQNTFLSTFISLQQFITFIFSILTFFKVHLLTAILNHLLPVF